MGGAVERVPGALGSPTQRCRAGEKLKAAEAQSKPSHQKEKLPPPPRPCRRQAQKDGGWVGRGLSAQRVPGHAGAVCPQATWGNHSCEKAGTGAHFLAA